MIITGGSLSESKLALHLAKEHGACSTCTHTHHTFDKIRRSVCHRRMSPNKIDRI